MALKTFNIDAEVYEKFSQECREKGMSMSKKIENFIKKELESMKISVEKLERTEKEVEKEFETKKEHPLSKYC